jgi:hypothetical protein
MKANGPGDLAGKILAAVAVSLASVRVAFWARRLPIHELPSRLRRVSRLPPVLRAPEYFAWASRRFRAHLPPSDFGPCLRQSLLLVDLLARCGIEATLHCGVRKSGGNLEGHAWVSVADGALLEQETVPVDFREVWAA